MNPTMLLIEDDAQVVEYKAVISGGCRRMVRAEPTRICTACGERRSRFYIRGTVKADRTHTLCFECYRRLVNRTRALRQGPIDIRILPSNLPAPEAQKGDRAGFQAELLRRRRQAILIARHAVDGLTGLARLVPTADRDGMLERVS
jgi:hypothetical protein